jgi:hypothetical protein
VPNLSYDYCTVSIRAELAIDKALTDFIVHSDNSEFEGVPPKEFEQKMLANWLHTSTTKRTPANRGMWKQDEGEDEGK